MCLLETGGPSLFTVNSDGGTIPYSWANGMRYELSVGSIYSVKKFRYTSQKKNPTYIRINCKLDKYCYNKTYFSN